MGRKSRLTDEQWQDIERRILEGESTRSVAKEYNITEGAVRSKISTQIKDVKTAANQILKTKQLLNALPISTQIKANNLADKLMMISNHLASAAEYGAMTAHKLAGMANAQAEMIDDSNPFATVENMKAVNALTSMANEAGKTAISLLNTNKEQVIQLAQPDEKEAMTLDEFYNDIEEADTKSSPTPLLAEKGA